MFRYLYLPLACMIMTTTSTNADDRYHVILFGVQDEANRPKMAHSFATFYKTSATDKLEEHTISWLPTTGNVKLLRLGAERGKNYSLAESLEHARERGTAVSAWGPFEIKKELYDMALQQAARLNSGQLGYIALDGFARGNGATNCIHALSDLDTTQPPLGTGTARGNDATRMVLDHYRKWLVSPDAPEVSLLEKLKLKDAGIQWMTPAAKSK